jgi:hypothetical protein
MRIPMRNKKKEAHVEERMKTVVAAAIKEVVYEDSFL